MPPLWPWRRIAKDVPGLAALLAGNEHHDPAESARAAVRDVRDAGDALVGRGRAGRFGDRPGGPALGGPDVAAAARARGP